MFSRNERALTEEQAIKKSLNQAEREEVNWDLVKAQHDEIQSEIKAFSAQHGVSEEIAREEVLQRWVEGALGAHDLEKRLAIAQEWMPKNEALRRQFINARRKVISNGTRERVRIKGGRIEVSGRPLGSGQELIDQIFQVELKIREEMIRENPVWKYLRPLKKPFVKDPETGRRFGGVLDAFAKELNRQAALRKEAIVELNEQLGRRVTPQIAKEAESMDRLQGVLEGAEKVNHALQRKAKTALRRKVGLELGKWAQRSEREGVMHSLLERLEKVAKARGLDPSSLSMQELMQDEGFRLEVQTAAYKLRYFLGPATFLGIGYAKYKAIAIPVQAGAAEIVKREEKKLEKKISVTEDVYERCLGEKYDLKRKNAGEKALRDKALQCAQIKGDLDAQVFEQELTGQGVQAEETAPEE